MRFWPRRCSTSSTAELDGAAIPSTVMGFRVSDAGRANKQLERLEAVLKQVLGEQIEVLGNQVPQLADRLVREKIGDTDFLTMRLDGSLIPWEQVFEEAGDRREDVEKLAEKVKPMTMEISLGVWKDYLIVSIADSSKQLATLGQGPKLMDRKELKPLSEYLDRRISGVTYASQDFLRQANASQEQFDELVSAAEQLVPFAQLDEKVQKELIADVGRLVTELKSYVQEPGAALNVAFMTDRGFEAYTYNWTPNPALDASQPLSILDHLGGTPIMAFAGRGKHDPDAFEVLSEIFSRAAYYGEQVALKQLESEERELYEELRDELTPLFKQLDQVTRETLVPAMKDGQAAFVVDADSKSKQWQREMPAAESELPMLELSCIMGVSDAKAVRQAAGQYFAIVQQMLDKLHAARPDDIPEVKLPKPETREFDGATVYYYRLREDFGVDKQIAPCAGLSKDFVAFSLVPRHLQRLFQATPLTLEGPVGDVQKPIATFAYCNFAEFVDAIRPWVTYGFKVASEQQDNPMLAMAQPQVETVLNVLKCFQEVTSVTYPQDDAWITHSEMHLVDME